MHPAAFLEGGPFRVGNLGKAQRIISLPRAIRGERHASLHFVGHPCRDRPWWRCVLDRAQHSLKAQRREAGARFGEGGLPIFLRCVGVPKLTCGFHGGTFRER